MNKIDKRELRHLNLMRLIHEKFLGRQADFAKAVSKNPTQVNHWISKHRNPNGDTCREIEHELGLKPDWLDQDHTAANPTQTAQPPQEYQQNKALELVQQAQPATNSVATLAQITAALSKHFETMDANTRKMAVGLLGQLADDPKDHARIAAMIEFSIHSKHQKLA